MIYKTKQLLDAKYDFSQVESNKQAVLKEKHTFEFNLIGLVDLLRTETNNFTIDNPVARDIDEQVYLAVVEYHHDKGEELSVIIDDEGVKREVKKPEPEKVVVVAEQTEEEMIAEWKEAAEGLKELIEMGGSDEELAEWKEAVEGLEILVS